MNGSSGTLSCEASVYQEWPTLNVKGGCTICRMPSATTTQPAQHQHTSPCSWTRRNASVRSRLFVQNREWDRKPLDRLGRDRSARGLLGMLHSRLPQKAVSRLEEYLEKAGHWYAQLYNPNTHDITPPGLGNQAISVDHDATRSRTIWTALTRPSGLKVLFRTTSACLIILTAPSFSHLYLILSCSAEALLQHS